jgi:hypothetical protein
VGKSGVLDVRGLRDASNRDEPRVGEGATSSHPGRLTFGRETTASSRSQGWYAKRIRILSTLI